MAKAKKTASAEAEEKNTKNAAKAAKEVKAKKTPAKTTKKAAEAAEKAAEAAVALTAVEKAEAAPAAEAKAEAPAKAEVPAKAVEMAEAKAPAKSGKSPLALIIMDGFGYRAETAGNAIAAAKTPNLDKLLKTCPNTRIGASGMDVGLPDGQMGNSEVGHTNIGAGRIVYQELTRITKAIQDGTFFENEAFLDAVRNCQWNNSTLHIFGLMSDGGVHSHVDHICALLDLAKRHGLWKVCVHCFMDGRDTPPTSGIT